MAAQAVAGFAPCESESCVGDGPSPAAHHTMPMPG
jgi:hypothetical protein